MRLRFLGTGDAFGSGGRFNTCFLVEGTQSDFLIDCGASTMIALRRDKLDPNRIGTIFVSHLHGDHFGGLPFFILDAQFYSRRTAPLTLVGPPGFRQRLHEAMELFFPGSWESKKKFSLDIREIEAGRQVAINALAVTPYVVNHACGAPPFGLRFEIEGKVLAYTGDTEWTETVVEIGQGADLLIAEALTFERPIKFHLDYASLKKNLGRIGAKRVVLTHLGPDMLAHAAEADHEIAHDGMVVDF
jgi:ribonuclease BN (tRNA processing enzyme)